MWFTLAQLPKPPKMPKMPAEVKAWQKTWDSVSSSPYLQYIFYIAGVIILFFLGRFLLKRWKARSASAAPQAITLTAKELISSWTDFLKAIPGDFRRSILHYKPFIVMGGSSSGKTQLIDKYTNWKGMARQFYPSYNSNSKLQFYLGTQSLIQEVSLPILEDSSKSARRALKKLWKKTFSKSEPVVVLVVPVNKLDNSSVDILRKQAQLLRGKINVIAWQRRESVKTRIALTHMDSIEGYAEFCKLLSNNNIPLNLDLNDYSTKGLATALEPYEKHLSLALTTMSSEEYLKIISFFQEAPKQLARIETFVKALCMVEPLSPVPELQEIVFTSNLEEDKLCIPFKVSATECIINRWTYRKHQLYAVATFAIIFGYGALGYFLENRRLDNIETHLNDFELRLQQEDDVKIRILDERFNELDIRADWRETVLFPKELEDEKNHLVNDLVPFLEKERNMLNDFPELDFFPPFFKDRTLEVHKLLDKEVAHLEDDIEKTNKLLTALEKKQKEWAEYERKQRVTKYREKVLLPLFNSYNNSDGKYLEEIYVLFALFAHKNRPFEIAQKQSGFKGNMLYEEIIADINLWVDTLDLNQDQHFAVLNEYMFRKDSFYNPDTKTYQYRFKHYLSEVYENFDRNITLKDKKVLIKNDEALDIDIVVEFYELLHEYTQTHNFITKGDLHRFRKMDLELTEFKIQLEERKEWLDLCAKYINQKKFLSEEEKLAKTEGNRSKNKHKLRGDYLPNLPREWALDVKERNELNQKDYKTFLETIRDTKLVIQDVSKMTFQEFMVTLHGYKDTDTKQKLTFELEGEKCEFDLNKWNKIIIHSKLQLTIEEYAKARNNHGYKIFFDSIHDHDNYDSIELTQISNGSFLFSGKSVIEGQYTKEAFENTIKPAVKEFLKFEKALDDKNVDDLTDSKEKVEHYTIKASTRRILENLLKNALHDYADKYSEAMTKFASALKVQASSEADLKYVIQQMRKTSSTFGVFLKKLHENTTIELDNGVYQPLVDKLKKFKYIKAVMREEKGDFPELDEYYGILEMMEKELKGEFIQNADNSQLPPENQTPQKQITGNDGLPKLQKQLSPMGQMTLNIFKGQSSSYYLRIKQWLDAVNMPNSQELRAPFYAPAVSAYRLGATELEKQVSSNWDLLTQKILVPMSQNFPFDKNSHKSISPDEVTSLLGVGGGFWRYLDSMLGPAVALYNGKWHKTSVTSIVELPPSMLPTLNRLQKLKTTLWNDEGQNKPLMVKVNAGLLPDAGAVYHIFDSLPVLAYMNAGNSSVLAFNQRPQWQDMKIDWWRPHVASIGIQFSTLDEETSVFSALNTGEKDWGLLYLLSQGSEVSDSSWVWNVDIDTAMQTVDHDGYAQLTANGPMNKMPVRFRFDKSLQDVFNLKLSWNIRKQIDMNLRNMHVPTWNKKSHGGVEDAQTSPSPYHTTEQLEEIFGLPPKENPFKLPTLNSKEDAASGL